MDKFVMVFTGKEGHYVKVMLFPPDRDPHYTLSVRLHPNDLASTIPIDIHKTWVRPEEKHQSLATGYFDPQPLIRRVTAAPQPYVKKVDLSSPEWREVEVIPTERLGLLSQTRELNITSSWAQNFTPVAVDQMGTTDFAITIPGSESRPGGFLFRNKTDAYFIGVPLLDNLEEIEQSIEDGTTMTKLADLEDEFADILEENDV